LVFQDAVSPGPRTPSSIPTIFTGELYTPSNQENENWDHRVSRIADHIKRYPTIPQQLKRQGYSTVGITANPWTTTSTNFDAGFDSFTEVGRVDASFENLPDLLSEPAKYFYQWRQKDGWFTQWSGYIEEINRAIDTLKEPYFLWIFSLDAHNPYLTPRQFRKETNAFKMYSSVLQANNALTSGGGESHLQSNMSERIDRWLKEAYRDAIHSVDKLSQWIWNKLQHTDPAFIFHSDHGEAFGEHGTYGHRPLLYEENISVPFLIANTGMSGNISQQFSLKHLPAILQSLGGGQQVEFEQFLDQPEYFSTETGRSEAVRDGDWKFIINNGESELYNIGTDDLEQVNLQERKTQIVERCLRKLNMERQSVMKREQASKGIQKLINQGEIIPGSQET
jgi:arylsulfatase